MVVERERERESFNLEKKEEYRIKRDELRKSRSSFWRA